MAPFHSPEDNLRYLLLVFKSIPDMQKPNYHLVAQEAGINNANNAQKRFKRIVEDAGFILADGRVSVKDGTEVSYSSSSSSAPAKSSAAAGVPKTKKTKATATATRTSKKRKLEDDDADSN